MKILGLLIAILSPLFIGYQTNKYPPLNNSKFNYNYQDSVLICDSENAYAYHAKWCTGLKRCTHQVKKVTLSEAKRLGFEKACGYCY
jgi:hypothetical protein